jgi:hypothetical protein
MNSLPHLNKATALLLVGFGLACFGSVTVKAVNPPPDGGYPGQNTAEGDNALFSLSETDGAFNTAVGWDSLFSNVTGSLNTGVGAGALALNTGHNNTATGAVALLLNDIGSNNTAVGTAALAFNGGGIGPSDSSGNTAVGAGAAARNTRGSGNTALGAAALANNSGSGSESSGNTAVGAFALTGTMTTTAQLNVAVGLYALTSDTEGALNTAVGASSDVFNIETSAALGRNTTGMFNTAFGAGALQHNTSGGSNIAVGIDAGENLTTGNYNIDMGNAGVADEANTIRIGTPFNDPTGQNRTFIAGIYGQPPGANTLPVVCADDGKLTANASSRRFKHDIKQMDKASEAILALKPVSFRYNNDSTDTPWFGLIAEDVAEINPDLIARDKEGNPFGVRYDQVNVMLLNEFLKEHRKVEQLQKQVEALTAGLQKVSAQLELAKPGAQTVLNNR